MGHDSGSGGYIPSVEGQCRRLSCPQDAWGNLQWTSENTNMGICDLGSSSDCWAALEDMQGSGSGSDFSVEDTCLTLGPGSGSRSGSGSGSSDFDMDGTVTSLSVDADLTLPRVPMALTRPRVAASSVII